MQYPPVPDERRRVEGVGGQVQDHLRQGGVPVRRAGVPVHAADGDGGAARLLRRRRRRPPQLGPHQVMKAAHAFDLVLLYCISRLRCSLLLVVNY